MRQAKSTADHAAIAKQIAYFVRSSAGGYVEVFRLAAQHQITNAAPHQVGRVPVPVQASNDFGRVLVDETSRDFMCVDDGFGRIVGEEASLYVVPLTEVGIYHSGHRIPKASNEREAEKLLLRCSNKSS
jgi:hypothetical protein